MIRTFFTFTLALACTSSVAADSPQLRYSKPLELPTLEKEELVAVPLDSDVYDATRDNLPDLRLLDGDGKEVAYVVKQATTKESRRERRSWNAKDPSVRPLENNGLEITFKLEESRDEQPEGLKLISPLRNFEHRVQVLSSADGENWEPLVEDGLIFDYSRFMDARNDSLELPQTEHRHFRIVIEDVTQEQQSQLMELTRRLRNENETDRSERVMVDRRPFRIDRIELWTNVVRNDVPRETSYPLTGFTVEQDAEAKQSIISVDSRREPLTSFTLVTSDRNFSRDARVETEQERGGQPHWRTIGSANLSQIDFRNLQRSNLEVPISETRQPKYRVVIDNRDSSPLDVTGVEARGPVYQVVFLVNPKQAYRLAYGNSSIEAPNYDTAALAASLAEGYMPIEATLGDELESQDAPELGEPLFTRLINDPRVLIPVIAVLVLLLGWGLYRATRQLDNLPPQ